MCSGWNGASVYAIPTTDHPNADAPVAMTLKNDEPVPALSQPKAEPPELMNASVPVAVSDQPNTLAPIPVKPSNPVAASAHPNVDAPVPVKPSAPVAASVQPNDEAAVPLKSSAPVAASVQPKSEATVPVASVDPFRMTIKPSQLALVCDHVVDAATAEDWMRYAIRMFRAAVYATEARSVNPPVAVPGLLAPEVSMAIAIELATDGVADPELAVALTPLAEAEVSTGETEAIPESSMACAFELQEAFHVTVMDVVPALIPVP